MKYDRDPEKLEELRCEYTELLSKLEQVQIIGELRQIDITSIRTMSKKVLDNLAAKYKNIRKEVDTIMGGKILEYEGKTIFQEGEKKGRPEGIDQANERVAKDMLLKKVFPISIISEISKLSEDVINTLAQSLGVAVVR